MVTQGPPAASGGGEGLWGLYDAYAQRQLRRGGSRNATGNTCQGTAAARSGMYSATIWCAYYDQKPRATPMLAGQWHCPTPMPDCAPPTLCMRALANRVRKQPGQGTWPGATGARRGTHGNSAPAHYPCMTQVAITGMGQLAKPLFDNSCIHRHPF